MFSDLSLVQKIAIWALPVLFAITLHEVAHGWVARWLGDNTAYAQGRLSLNPLAHIDPVGTLLVPALLLFLGGFLFGWAKPVPVNFRNLRNPKRDMAIVAIAGPLTNLAMAIGWVILLRICAAMPAAGVGMGLRYMAVAGVGINLALMVLNLIPLPPLDGGRVAVGLLPMKSAVALSRLEPYGMMILILLMVTGVLGRLIGPPMMMAQSLLFSLAGLQ